ncbi:MAG: flagellar hook-length control protein FliK [Chitinispirillales bacterium]|nr:flagellar hook-length control protein FliK [Chitinispirillales bacterium]
MMKEVQVPAKAGDSSGINRKMDHAKSENKKQGKATGFGDEVKKFSGADESSKTEADDKDASNNKTAKADSQNEVETNRKAESRRSSKEEQSAVKTVMNKYNRADTDAQASGIETGESKAVNGEASVSEGQLEYAHAAVNSENHASFQFGKVNSGGITLNIQEFSPAVVDKAESFKAMRDQARQSHVHRPQPEVPVFSAEDTGSVEAAPGANSVEGVNADSENGAVRVDREALYAQAREFLEQSKLHVFDMGQAVNLSDVDVNFRVELNPQLNPKTPEELRAAVSKPVAEVPGVLEHVVKMLETMALNGQPFDVFQFDGSDPLHTLLKGWEGLQQGQGQTLFTGIVNAADVTGETGEKQGAFIPLATDPSQLPASSSDVKLADDRELMSAIERISVLSGDQGKAAHQQKEVINLTPVDSQAMRAMFGKSGQNCVTDEKAVSDSQKAVSSENLKTSGNAVFDSGPKIPVSYTELAAANTAQNTVSDTVQSPHSNLPSDNSAAQSSSNPLLNANVNTNMAVSGGDGSVNLTIQTMEAAQADAASGDPQEIMSGNQPNAAKALEAAEKAASSLSRVDQQAIINQLNEKMQIAIRQGVQEMRITLRPQELGEVRMSIKVEGDQVTARMIVESDQVKAVVEKHFQQLRDALEQQNLHAAKLSVDVGTGNERQQMWREMAESANHRRSKQGSDSGQDGNEQRDDTLAGVSGNDTGRRFGNNTFELFV